MTTDIKTLVQDLKDYYFEITNYDHLTSIQKKEYVNTVKQKYFNNGIEYWINHYDNGGDDVQFQIANMYIEDFGIIHDIYEIGQYPIQLKVEKNVSISYEPRNLDKLPDEDKKSIKNNECFNLNKGSTYKFSGKLTECRYILGHGGQFYFKLIGNENNKIIQNVIGQNKKKAQNDILKATLQSSVLGFFIGIGCWLIIRLIILPICSWSKYGIGGTDSPGLWSIIVILFCTFLVGAIVYNNELRIHRESKRL